MTNWISGELPLFIFNRVDISWASHIHPSQNLWRFQFAVSFHGQFWVLDILCAWIGDSSKMLWRFEFLETLHCSFSSVSLYYEPESDIRVKFYDNSNFSRASVVHFRGSRYFMGTTHTPESKVMAVWIFRELTCSISSVSIYYESESDILVKSYDHLNFLRASVVHFQGLDIWWASHIHLSQRLWPF